MIKNLARLATILPNLALCTPREVAAVFKSIESSPLAPAIKEKVRNLTHSDQVKLHVPAPVAAQFLAWCKTTGQTAPPPDCTITVTDHRATSEL